MRGRTIVCTVVLAVPVLLTAASATWASDGRVGLTVSPPLAEIAADPGQVVMRHVKLENFTGLSAQITAERVNFEPSGEEGLPRFTSHPTQLGFRSWIEVSPLHAELAAGETKAFDVRIAIPRDAEPGTHLGAVIFRTSPRPSGAGSRVAVSQEITSLMLLKISGRLVERATLNRFDVATFVRAPVPFTTEVRNRGNVHFKPRVTITVQNLLTRHTTTIFVDSGNVLPQSVRRFPATWKPSWLFGLYRAKLTVSYGHGHADLTSSRTFFGYPGVKVLVLGAIGAVILVLLRRRLGRALYALVGRTPAAPPKRR
jgi:hypothetical protein